MSSMEVLMTSILGQKTHRKQQYLATSVLVTNTYLITSHGVRPLICAVPGFCKRDELQITDRLNKKQNWLYNQNVKHTKQSLPDLFLSSISVYIYAYILHYQKVL